MPTPIYSIKDLNISKGKYFKLHIKQFDIHRGAVYMFSGKINSGKSLVLDILYQYKTIIFYIVVFIIYFNPGLLDCSWDQKFINTHILNYYYSNYVDYHLLITLLMALP